MKKVLDEIVNEIYVITYSSNRKKYTTSYLSEKRAREHAQFLADSGAKFIHICRINLWME